MMQLALLVTAVAFQVAVLLAAAGFAANRPQDLFQDYISARQLLARAPLYPPLAPFRAAYFSGSFGPMDYITVNAHPPLSILFTLPVALLPYSAASWTWEITGLLAYAAMCWLIFKGLALWPSDARPRLLTLVGLLAFPAVVNSAVYVTLSPYVSLLLVGVWSCYRSGRRDAAAVLLGLAIALKIYPALMLGVFLLMRAWRTTVLSALAAAAIFLVTLPVLGIDAYRDYLGVGAQVSWWIGTEGNLSLAGFFGRLFVGGPYMAPVAELPWLAPALTGATCGAVLLLAVWAAPRTEARRLTSSPVERFDLLYATALIILMLVNPLTWAHYLGAAILSWSVLFKRARAGVARAERWTLVTIATLAVGVPFAMRLATLASGVTLQDDVSSGPLENLVQRPILTYLILCSFWLSLRHLRSAAPRGRSSVSASSG
ncbi:MAG: DUF2029 domain-containing protein [Chloroflexi bacterium]|nr:DUF2029 domain-containing protein [Chloroflexota bacterium]